MVAQVNARLGRLIVRYVHAVPRESRRGGHSLLGLELQMAYGCWESNPGSVEEQPVF